MSLHVFANFVTPFGTAANNRAETEGNITTLQKILWMGEMFSTVSAEAVRFALRRRLGPEETNRTWDEDDRVNAWKDWTFKGWDTDEGKTYIDDDLLGFMTAEAAKDDGSDSSEGDDAKEKGKEKKQNALPLYEGAEVGDAAKEKGKGKKGEKKKGSANVRRAVLEVTRAISLTPWAGDVTFNAASPGATPSAQKKGTNPVPYGTELHATRYQYGIALTPERLRDKSRAAKAIDALCKLGTVAGNHGRFLFDFSPDAVVFRLTDDPAPRLLYCFDTNDAGKTFTAGALLKRIAAGDVLKNELIVGVGDLDSPLAEQFKAIGVAPLGVKAACAAAVKKINGVLKIKE
jgi:CRISPR-associated protein Cst2